MVKGRYRQAVGLVYREGGAEAPIIGVSGEGPAADEIVKAARRFGVPVVSDPSLARALAGVEIDREIPEQLFKAVALLLASIEQRARAAAGRIPPREITAGAAAPRRCR